MKATLDRKEFLSAYNRVSGFASPRSPKTVLKSVLLKSDENGGWSLSATDLEVGICCPVAVDSSQGGAVLLSDKFGAILKTGGADEIEIEVKDENLTVYDGTNKFTIPTEDPETFPTHSSSSFENCWAVSCQELKTLIRRTHFATDPQSTRYALGGCLLEVQGKTFSLAGTDGRRLALANASYETIGSPSQPHAIVVPARTLRLLDRLLDYTQPVRIAINSPDIWFDTEHGVIWSRLVDGRFPRYQDVFPKERGVRARVDSDLLDAGLSQAGIVCSEESRGVDMVFTASLLTLLSKSAEVGSSKVHVPIEYDGAPLQVRLDPRMISDALSAVEGQVEIEIIGPSAAIQVHADQYRFVVMPLTRDAEA